MVLLEALFELSLAVLAMFLQLFEIRLDAMVLLLHVIIGHPLPKHGKAHVPVCSK